jgi:hypothetical protein
VIASSMTEYSTGNASATGFEKNRQACAKNRHVVRADPA